MWLSFVSSVAWLEWAKAVFDLLKGVAWPLSLFLIVWLFRSQLRARIPDLISVGPGGAVLQPPKQPTQPDLPTGLPAQNTDVWRSDLSLAKHPLPTVQEVIDQIKVQLPTVPEEERVSRLVVGLAEAQIERNFEHVWGLIFGSQIKVLERLKVEDLSYDEAKLSFEAEVLRVTPGLKGFDFHQWTQFLLGQELVTLKEDRFSLTQLGRDFLVFKDLRKQGQVKAL
ncbi:Hypothetical protein NGAL_HAMBI2566_17280 [Neorhizobium galegae bv. orientalis]|nr:Hypothetical protein NGAL_HAMBI2566_17280 [Neorhizobium galegae bv. orientalis]